MVGGREGRRYSRRALMQECAMVICFGGVVSSPTGLRRESWVRI